MRTFRALRALSVDLDPDDTDETGFTSSAIKWIIKADEILAGVGIAFFAIVWFVIILAICGR